MKYLFLLSAGVSACRRKWKPVVMDPMTIVIKKKVLMIKSSTFLLLMGASSLKIIKWMPNVYFYRVQNKRYVAVALLCTHIFLVVSSSIQGVDEAWRLSSPCNMSFWCRVCMKEAQLSVDHGCSKKYSISFSKIAAK